MSATETSATQLVTEFDTAEVRNFSTHRMVSKEASSSAAGSGREVRVLLVGDRGVGKTSLVYSLVTEEFPEEVPPRAEEITIPPDVTPDHVTTQIVDYSAAEQSQEELVAELERASVVCVVFSVDDDETIDRVTQYWLPFIRDTLGEDHGRPIVLVGNKTDLIEYSSLEVILPVMTQYTEVETCVESSARELKNISELFYYAQKAVLHPTGPLYSPDERDLTPRCRAALSRIFRLSDADNDGILSDEELNAFQERVFNSPLQPQALDDVKSIVKRNIQDGVFDDGLTLAGFLFLQTLFIQRGRHDTTWTILRRYGYTDRVELKPELVSPPLAVPLGSSTELTLEAYNFLRRIFRKYDRDRDGSLSPAELQNLFATCPRPAWDPHDVIDQVQTDDKGWVTLSGFLAKWTLITSIDYRKALEFFAYLGYGFAYGSDEHYDDILSAITVTRDKRVDLDMRQTSRNTFVCHVIGPQGAGKSSFLRGLLGKSLEEHFRDLERRKSKQRQQRTSQDFSAIKEDSYYQQTTATSCQSQSTTSGGTTTFAGISINPMGAFSSLFGTSVFSSSDTDSGFGTPAGPPIGGPAPGGQLVPSHLVGSSSLGATETQYSINTVQVYGQEKYLIMREIDLFNLNDKLSQPELSCDVACLLYDRTDPKSFEYIARIFLKHFSDCRLPILIVAAKCDVTTSSSGGNGGPSNGLSSYASLAGSVRQNYVLQPDEFCAKYKLPPPHPFTVRDADLLASVPGREIYSKVATMAAYPTLKRLVHVLLMQPTPSWLQQHISTLHTVMPQDREAWLRAGVGLASVAIVGLFLLKFVRFTNPIQPPRR